MSRQRRGHNPANAAKNKGTGEIVRVTHFSLALRVAARRPSAERRTLFIVFDPSAEALGYLQSIGWALFRLEREAKSLERVLRSALLRAGLRQSGRVLFLFRSQR